MRKLSSDGWKCTDNRERDLLLQTVQMKCGCRPNRLLPSYLCERFSLPEFQSLWCCWNWTVPKWSQFGSSMLSFNIDHTEAFIVSASRENHSKANCTVERPFKSQGGGDWEGKGSSFLLLHTFGCFFPQGGPLMPTLVRASGGRWYSAVVPHIAMLLADG